LCDRAAGVLDRAIAGGGGNVAEEEAALRVDDAAPDLAPVVVNE